MGYWHARYAVRVGGMIAAVVDRDESAAVRLGRSHPGARVFDDLSACLAGTAVEVVHICTPLASHVALAEVSLRIGKHVLVEKPLSVSVAETRHLLTLAKERGRKLCVVHQFPFQDGFRRACRNLDRLGELVEASLRICSAGGDDRDPAQRRRVLQEIAPHAVSLLRALRDPEAAAPEWTVREYTSDELAFTGATKGVRFEALISLRGRPTRNELLLIGTHATALIDLFHGYAVIEEGTVGRLAKALRPLRFGVGLFAAAGLNLVRRAWKREPAYPGLRTLIGEFYGAIREQRPAPITEVEMLEAAALLERLATD
jgi:predicted dehydrogenase